MATSLPTRDMLLVSLRADQDRFNALVGLLSDADQEKAFTPEGWSVKDFLSHMTHWKRATHALLVAYFHDQPLPAAIPEGDEVNAQQRQQDAARPLADVQAAWEEVHERLQRLVRDEADDTRLADEVRLPWSDTEERPICLLIRSMCNHDAEHFTLIEHHFHIGSEQ
ncbi:MAG TPA: DinB family protein [Ktedonobacteraceae bacterium]|nr:DinB family protein [Ktedonobacteraceae bacterium]